MSERELINNIADEAINALSRCTHFAVRSDGRLNTFSGDVAIEVARRAAALAGPSDASQDDNEEFRGISEEQGKLGWMDTFDPPPRAAQTFIDEGAYAEAEYRRDMAVIRLAFFNLIQTATAASRGGEVERADLVALLRRIQVRYESGEFD